MIWLKNSSLCYCYEYNTLLQIDKVYKLFEKVCYIVDMLQRE